MTKKTTLAIVLGWNDKKLTHRCIESLYLQRGESCDVLLVDNYSETDPIPYLKSCFPKMFCIRNKVNLGAGGGRNVGIRWALERGYRYILWIDNDAYAEPHMLNKLMKGLARDPRLGAVGPKILKDVEPRIVWRAGCTSWKWTYLHTGPEVLDRLWKVMGRSPRAFLDTSRGKDQSDRGQFDREEYIDFLFSCVILARCELIRDVGMFDEAYSLYGSEDIDFCARVIKSKWRLGYVPSALAWHRIGSSFKDEYKRAYYNSRNILLLARKNLHPAYFWCLFLPDHAFLTIPLKILESLIRSLPKRRKALGDAIIWNFCDAFLRSMDRLR